MTLDPMLYRPINKEVTIDFRQEYSPTYEIGEFIEWLQACKAKAPGEEINVELESDYESSEITISISYTRLETQEEANKRAAKMESWKREDENRERREFERLKKKYEREG